MQAGRIEPGKNQAMLCWALRHTDVPIVLIGGSKHWPSYADLCRSISGSRLTIIDHIPQNLSPLAMQQQRYMRCQVGWKPVAW